MNFIPKKLWLCALLCLGLSAQIIAEENLAPQKEFTYEGQIAEILKLSNVKKETRYRDKEVESTCTKQTPYTKHVCENVTKYNQQCETIPGYENCYNVTEQECESVPTTSTKCHTTPGRNVCHEGPSRTECRTEYNNICHPGPSRRECRTVKEQSCSYQPGREICRTNRKTGEQVCKQLPGRRVCESTPRQVCETVPGPEVCKTTSHNVCEEVPGPEICNWESGETICEEVTEYESVCENVTRNKCEWVPSQESCESIPYTEEVCGDKTFYKTEEYACTKTVKEPYEVTLKKFFAELNFEEFKSDVPGAKAVIKASLSTEGQLTLEVEDRSETPALILVEEKPATPGEEVTETPVDSEIVESKVAYVVNFMDKAAALSPLQVEPESIRLTRRTLSFNMGKITKPELLTMKLTLTTKAKKANQPDVVLVDRLIKAEEMTVAENGWMSFVTIELKKVGVRRKLRSNKDHKLKIELGLNSDAKVLNADLSELKKVKEMVLKPARR